jgi:hypothetical protein
MPTIAIDPRFAGMPSIAHGGYLAGVLARDVDAPAAEVRLKRPVEPGRQVTVESTAEIVAPIDLDLEVPSSPTPAQAEAASHRFPGHGHHLFPDCFVCGPARAEGDGLRIFPGLVRGRRIVAAPWTPPADGGGELVWAAFDCAQLWSLMVDVPADTPDRVVTSALAARIDRPVTPGEPHIVVGWPIGRDGRRWLAGAALFGPDGDLRAVGRQTAAVVEGWGVPLGRDSWGATAIAA